MSFPLAFIEGIGGPELLMIMFIILLLFGANRLPDLARGLPRLHAIHDASQSSFVIENSFS